MSLKILLFNYFIPFSFSFSFSQCFYLFIEFTFYILGCLHFTQLYLKFLLRIIPKLFFVKVFVSSLNLLNSVIIFIFSFSFIALPFMMVIVIVEFFIELVMLSKTYCIDLLYCFCHVTCVCGLISLLLDNSNQPLLTGNFWCCSNLANFRSVMKTTSGQPVRYVELTLVSRDWGNFHLLERL